MANLAAAFSSLSDEIKDWIGSPEVTDLIIELGKDFELDEEQNSGVSHAIMRLITQDLGPMDFISELANQLQIDKERAKNIVEKIIGGILDPIKASLKQSGVDVDLMIKYSRESTPNQSPEREPVPYGASKLDVRQAPQSQQPAPEAVPASPSGGPPENLPVPPQRPKPMLPDKPFILHQEENEAIEQESFLSKPSFRYIQPDKNEIVEQPTKTEVEGLRVVHYSSFLTPFNQADIKQLKENSIIPVPKSKWFI